MGQSRRPIPSSVRAEVWDKSGGTCAYCGAALHPILTFTIDHIVPLKRGGTDDSANLVASCRECNSSKRDRDAAKFAIKAAAAGPRKREENSLRSIRESLGMSAEQLAAAATVSLRAYGAIERGESTPRLSTMKRLAEALGVDPLEIDEFRAAIMGAGTGERLS